MAVGEVATRDFLRSELRTLLSELDTRDQEAREQDARDQDLASDSERGQGHPTPPDPDNPPT
jgi:hypothetical protein